MTSRVIADGVATKACDGTSSCALISQDDRKPVVPTKLVSYPVTATKGASCFSGCAEWNADYTMTVIASSLELAPEQYDRNCLDADVYCPTGQE